METQTLTESQDLPRTSGTLLLDTSGGPITIIMTAGQPGDQLTLTKISHDLNLVSLYSPTTLINGMEITIFGLPVYAKVTKGKIQTLVLQSDGTHWQIQSEK